MLVYFAGRQRYNKGYQADNCHVPQANFGDVQEATQWSEKYHQLQDDRQR